MEKSQKTKRRKSLAKIISFKPVVDIEKIPPAVAIVRKMRDC